MSLCECGCGESTRLAPWSDVNKGWTRGEPLRFVKGHRQRMPNPNFHRTFPPAMDRFLASFIVLDDEQGGCWEWDTQAPSARYARFEGKQAHAWSYEHFVGAIPEGLEVDHICRNTWCVNPDHLEPVTHVENMRRGLHGVLKTHCVHGHEYTPENTYPSGSNSRRCRTCHLARCKARRARKQHARQAP